MHGSSIALSSSSRQSRRITGRATCRRLLAQVTPRHWATGALAPEMEMAQDFALDGEVAQLR